ncbi:hypothetical protein VKT23_003693 [Stygiomarasmius scandens]|uniref:Uncharacterized protein n=1 Tax=Marasmiellus scandens TaxID=2682957 RepID=A0ABR1K4E3_9AGAR
MEPVSKPRSKAAKKPIPSYSRPHRLSVDIPKTSASVLVVVPPARDEAYGSFTPTASVFSSLRHLMSTHSRPTLFAPFRRARHASMFEWPDSDTLSDVSSPPSSPAPSHARLAPPTIPSISRTSSYGTSGVLSPASSSSTTLSDTNDASTVPFPKTKLNPILDSLERKLSKMRKVWRDVVFQNL